MIQSIKNLILLVTILTSFQCVANNAPGMPKQWSALESILLSRESQTEAKMKLTKKQVNDLVSYLRKTNSTDLIHLQKLQPILPKTTVELLFALQARDLDKAEAEKMAAYLFNVPNEYHIQNVKAFDENTSHIIGREWQEIDYSNEGMTWQGQKAKYASFGISNFKSLENLKKFFPVESKMPYFYQAYGYQN
jgi:hypothetical protein